ncbi:MAG TPA: aminopeptidase [Gemmatimonadaceae bacterium]|nr:aminopeptidase [Gemmatimonadaceae bacterium]
MIWRVLLGIGAVGAAFLVFTPTGRYLVRGAYEEARILVRRQPIEKLVRDTTVDEATRAKLRLVLEARQYAVDSIRLRAKKSFTKYTELDNDTLVLVLSVAYRDRLALKTWSWPIVGTVPYKGFFNFDAARKEQAKYERDGFDTDLRPSAAFSTLGWFNDPLLSTTLRADSTWLVETVIHELLHNTVWIKDDVTFNESFASFVGRHGAASFFRARGDSTLIARMQRARETSRALAVFYAHVYAELDSAFKALPGDSARDARIAARDSIFVSARHRLATVVAPSLGVTDTTWAHRVRLNIATVLARRVYREEVDGFERILGEQGGDLRRAIERIGEVARAAPKGRALDAFISSSRFP